MKQKFYQKIWIVLLFLITFPPIGIILLWTNKRFSKKLRIILTLFYLFIFAINYPNENNNLLNNEDIVTITIEWSVSYEQFRV